MQIYAPFKKTKMAVRLCNRDIKEWLASNSVNLNKKKTEVILLEPSGPSILSLILTFKSHTKSSNISLKFFYDSEISMNFLWNWPLKCLRLNVSTHFPKIYEIYETNGNFIDNSKSNLKFEQS